MKPDARPGLAVAKYLRPEEKIVPFRVRPELSELLSWCGATRHVAARLVTGDGGAGRLALHCSLSRKWLRTDGSHCGYDAVGRGRPRMQFGYLGRGAW